MINTICHAFNTPFNSLLLQSVLLVFWGHTKKDSRFYTLINDKIKVAHFKIFTLFHLYSEVHVRKMNMSTWVL